MKKIIKKFDVILSAFCCIIFALIYMSGICIPSEVIFYDGKEQAEYLNIYYVKKSGNGAVAASVNSENSCDVSADASILGIIPIGKLKAKEADRKYVYAGGSLVGIRLYTDGLVVVGTDDVVTAKGNICPAADCGIMQGDIIISVNGEEIKSVSDFSGFVTESGGENINITVKRDGENLILSLTPAYSEAEQKYRCGLWLRDSTAGIGTLTFADPETEMFASLGHAICDSETQAMLPVGDGDILSADVTGCIKGTKGTTGQIKGNFAGEVLGELYDNNEFGVYGTYSDISVESGELYPVASQSETETGKAQIIATVTADGEREFYDIEIEKITYSSEKETRSMVIRITDEDLLAVTGGIVQGMSGSPIIQDGMLVGAVTHVFLNDPTRGYGIFAETMLSTSANLAEQYD